MILSDPDPAFAELGDLGAVAALQDAAAGAVRQAIFLTPLFECEDAARRAQRGRSISEGRHDMLHKDAYRAASGGVPQSKTKTGGQAAAFCGCPDKQTPAGGFS
jgi:hypothetical protein